MSNPETSSKKVIWFSSLAIIFVLVFCAGFVVFYTRNDRNKAAPEPVNSGNPLPAAELVDESHQLLADSQLKNGKVVLVFMTADCDACMKESEFLKDVVNKRQRRTLLRCGFIWRREIPGRSEEKIPLSEVFYDRGFRLSRPTGN